MTVNKARYYVPNYGPNTENAKLALSTAAAIVAKGAHKSIHLLVPSKKTFPETQLGTFLGDVISKKLVKGEVVSVGEIDFSLSSCSRPESYTQFGVVIGLYISKEDFGVMDSKIIADGIVLLPWTDAEGETWVSTWGPQVVGATGQASEPSNPAPEVVVALESITGHINMSTGLSHPSDKKFAQDKLKSLRSQGILFDPELIRQWAVRNGWDPDDADELKKLAERHTK